MLYGQPVFGGVQDRGQEQELVVSPERLEWLQELQPRVAELARATLKAKMRRGGTGEPVTHRPGHRPRGERCSLQSTPQAPQAVR